MAAQFPQLFESGQLPEVNTNEGKFNIQTSIHKNNVLYIKTASAQTFKKLVEPI